MYFLYRFQMKKMKVFMGFTNQLKDVFGRLEQRMEKAVELRQSKAKLHPVQFSALEIYNVPLAAATHGLRITRYQISADQPVSLSPQTQIDACAYNVFLQNRTPFPASTSLPAQSGGFVGFLHRH